MDTTPNLITIMGCLSRHLFDPVGALQVHQVVAQTQERFCVAGVTFLPQVLADQVEYGGEGAEEVVFLDMEL